MGMCVFSTCIFNIWLLALFSGGLWFFYEKVIFLDTLLFFYSWIIIIVEQFCAAVLKPYLSWSYSASTKFLILRNNFFIEAATNIHWSCAKKEWPWNLLPTCGNRSTPDWIRSRCKCKWKECIWSIKYRAISIDPI